MTVNVVFSIGDCKASGVRPPELVEKQFRVREGVARLASMLNHKVSKIPGPSISLFLRSKWSSCLQSDEKLSHFIPFCGNLND
jgi:hypothetical protein